MSKLDINDIKTVDCVEECELSARYGLPCQHWMIYAISEEISLLLSLIHSYWLYDDSDSLIRTWCMTFIVKKN